MFNAYSALVSVICQIKAKSFSKCCLISRTVCLHDREPLLGDKAFFKISLNVFIRRLQAQMNGGGSVLFTLPSGGSNRRKVVSSDFSLKQQLLFICEERVQK